MSYEFYKILHFSGIFLVLISLGAMASHMLQGGTKSGFKNKKFFGAVHGVGLLLAFVAGFGLMARTGFGFDQGWIYGKLLIWLALGMYPMVFYKKGQTKGAYLGLLVVAFVAIYLAVLKPF